MPKRPMPASLLLAEKVEVAWIWECLYWGRSLATLKSIVMLIAEQPRPSDHVIDSEDRMDFHQSIEWDDRTLEDPQLLLALYRILTPLGHTIPWRYDTKMPHVTMLAVLAEIDDLELRQEVITRMSSFHHLKNHPEALGFRSLLMTRGKVPDRSLPTPPATTIAQLTKLSLDKKIMLARRFARADACRLWPLIRLCLQNATSLHRCETLVAPWGRVLATLPDWTLLSVSQSIKNGTWSIGFVDEWFGRLMGAVNMDYAVSRFLPVRSENFDIWYVLDVDGTSRQVSQIVGVPPRVLGGRTEAYSWYLLLWAISQGYYEVGTRDAEWKHFRLDSVRRFVRLIRCLSADIFVHMAPLMAGETWILSSVPTADYLIFWSRLVGSNDSAWA